MRFLLIKIRLVNVSYVYKKSISVSYKGVSYKLILSVHQSGGKLNIVYFMMKHLNHETFYQIKNLAELTMSHSSKKSLSISRS